MRVFVGCEFSQVVCMAFRKRGHEAFSCDLLPCEGGHPEWHIQDDVLKHLGDGWDLGIFHPPCTKISYAGTSQWDKPGRIAERLEALEFFRKLWEAPIGKICIENPKSCASPVIAKYSQLVQPYFFGEPYMKTTWLWLKNLPLLVPTKMLPKPKPIYVDKSGKQRHWTEHFGSKEIRGHIRSRTFPCIADAMAEQWGTHDPTH